MEETRLRMMQGLRRKRQRPAGEEASVMGQLQSFASGTSLLSASSSSSLATTLFEDEDAADEQQLRHRPVKRMRAHGQLLRSRSFSTLSNFSVGSALKSFEETDLEVTSPARAPALSRLGRRWAGGDEAAEALEPVPAAREQEHKSCEGCSHGSVGSSSCSSGAPQGIEEDQAVDEQVDEEEETCFICMGAFSAKRPSMRIPCASQCNKSPVHGHCIYEWSECKSQHGDRSSCPLCRGPLAAVDFVPRDKLGSHRFASDREAKRDFITRPVPRGFTMRYELYLQAPTTLKYPLGPLPNATLPKPGDILLAVSTKQISRWGYSQLDISMDESSFQAASDGYLGCVYSSFTGLEHTIAAPFRSGDAEDSAELKMCELGAVRYTQNRIGRAVGPRRIHVCFPRVVPAQSSDAPDMDRVVPDPQPLEGFRSMARPFPPAAPSSPCDTDADADADVETAVDGDKQRDSEPAAWSTMAHFPTEKDNCLPAILRDASQPAPTQHARDFLFGANKTPYWLPSINAFSLDFGGRVTLPSNKNFQLMMQDSQVALQFGKIAERDDLEVFTLDVSWPLSPLQAMGVALSALDRKMLCA
ncbi:Tubby-like F-box protein 2 (AtTLP2) [Durusdinium trenchii]|uniref:Tubby-like F-box protein 2 (AtTLP2) n=1 Tax=Durusdinium trenchii TaxID=1381693 RepID=A0ABP0LEZ1_9DINO